jgi:F-type H+-transporting ATPase subunit delta
MTQSAVATRYANALADVVTSGASATGAEAVLAELRAFQSTLSTSAELQNALTSPAVPPSRKRAVVAKLGDILKLSRVTRNLLFVLIDHRRLASLTDIIQSFETVADERLGFARAEISSARELSEPQRSKLNSQLEQLTGKRIRARYATDESLIGGVVARIGSTVYDGSVRGQLETLGRRLSTEG